MLLIGAIAVTVYLQIEFLYLALIAVLILLLIADRQSAPRPYEPQPTPDYDLPQGPVVIQQAPASPAHDFIDSLVNGIIQQSRADWTEEERLKTLDKDLKNEIGGLRDEVSSLRKQLEKDEKK